MMSCDDSSQSCRLCALILIYSTHMDVPDFISEPIASVAKARLLIDRTKEPDFTALM